MRKFFCDECEWVYDEFEGALELGIEPETEFDDLPEDFECPVCGADKSNFTED